MTRHGIAKLLFGALLISIAACDNPNIPGLTTEPLTVASGLDPRYSILPSGGIDRLYTVRPSDATTRLLDARKANGAIVWSVSIPACESGFTCIPVLDDVGNIYLTTSQGLTSLKPTDGSVRWTNSTAKFSWIATGTNGRIYTIDRALGIQSVYALDAAAGSIIWKTILPAADGLPLVVDETRQTVYVGGRGGPTAIDTQTGSIKWRVIHSCIGGGHEALAADGTIYVTCDSDFTSILYAYDPTGTEKWHADLGTAAGTFTPLIDDSGNIYASNPSSVISLTPTGTVNWRLTGLTQNFVEPAIDTNRNVYVIAKLASDAGWNLLAIKDGVVASNKGAIDPTFAGALLLAPDGRLYFNANGSLLSYATPGVNAAAAWVQFGRDYARSSRR